MGNDFGMELCGEPLIDMEAASKIPFAGGINAVRSACSLWKKEQKAHKAEASRKGLRHLQRGHAFLTTRTWVLDYILRKTA